MLEFIKRTIRIFRESFAGFIKDKCYLHASSLTFYTLLSIVPTLAVVFGLAKGFGFEKNLEENLHDRLSEHREIVDLVVEFARSLLEQAEKSYITGIGVAFLFLFVISLFWTIEASMNDIWKVKRSRPFLRIITDYLAMMVLCPLFLVIASSLTVFFATRIGEVVEKHEMFKGMAPLLVLGYRGVTLVFIWLLFTCVYMIMPNTRVPAKYASLAGVIAGTAYYLFFIAMVKFQIGVSQYSAIYGSFAALPLFLFWLQISWLIVLFGAEFAYHAQHLHPTLKFSKERSEVNFQVLAVLLSSFIIDSFKKGEKAWTLKRLSEFFGIAESQVETALRPLIDSQVFTSVKSDNTDVEYLPAKDIHSITLQEVLIKSNPLLIQKTSINTCEELVAISRNLESFEKEMKHTPLHELVVAKDF